MNYLTFALLLMAMPVVYVMWITYRFLKELEEFEDWVGKDDEDV